MTTIERFVDSSWDEIQYSEWNVEKGVGEVLIAPKATVRTHTDQVIDANERLRIRDGSTTIFEGRTSSSGRKDMNGGRKVKVNGYGYDLFEESVDISLGSTNDENVLLECLLQANRGSNYTISHPESSISISSYEVENRSVKRVFRDMMDHTGKVWWVDHDSVIHVQSPGYRGEWRSLQSGSDAFNIMTFDPGEVETVRNHVTVNGSGDISTTVSNATSISNYGRRSEEFTYEFIGSTTEAQSIASELLVPDPLPEGRLLVGGSVGDIYSNLSNHTITITDTDKNIFTETLEIEKQEIREGRVELVCGEGAGIDISSVNRQSQSSEDKSDLAREESGDVDDGSVTQQKLADLAVAVGKIQNDAISESKVRQDAISETSIQDDAITTPKINAGAVKAGSIDSAVVDTIHLSADAITSDKILAGEIGAAEIATGVLTADHISTLDLTTDELTISNTDGAYDSEISFISDGSTVRMLSDGSVTIGVQATPIAAGFINDFNPNQITPINGQDTGFIDGFSSVRAYEFIDANDGSTISDGGDPLEGLSGMDTPPDFVRDPSPEGGVRVNKLSRWLFDIATEQQSRIESLEERLSELEAFVGE